jgi:hypothetical protein
LLVVDIADDRDSFGFRSIFSAKILYILYFIRLDETPSATYTKIMLMSMVVNTKLKSKESGDNNLSELKKRMILSGGMKSKESGDNNLLGNLSQFESITETGDEEEDHKEAVNVVHQKKKQKKNDERQDKNLKIAQSAFHISHSLKTAENHLSNAFNEINVLYEQLFKKKR